jgi:iron complex outermembrane receptor protein
MKKSILFLVFIAVCNVFAQAREDSLLIQGRDIPEVEVVARVEQPTETHKKLSGEDLNRTNTGQNLPYLLQTTPSLLVTSDDGLGIGYTYFRVRGTDHTRINMTVNDVPLNDSESQTVFWVNMTDFASGLTSLNVQRGVGTSTNGSAAFGAPINMTTLPTQKMLNDTAPAHVTLLFNGGMYNTFREMVAAQVQLPRNFRIEARLSKVNSDGYLYRAASDLFSYNGSIGYYGKKTNVTLSAFGGTEKTYMAWDGVSAADLQRDRRYNPAGEYIDKDGNIAYYPNQNDNYKQQHFQLHLAQRLTQQWTLNATLHYTHGDGYYEQMKAEYGKKGTK